MTEAAIDFSTLTEIANDSITEITSTILDYESTTSTIEGVFNSSNSKTSLGAPLELEDTHYTVFVVFNILEIIMTSVELTVWIIAAIKMPRWRRNYRNQMLMQISVARFLKRIIFSFKFFHENQQLSSMDSINVALKSSEIYIDIVIVILVFFFIKHMYNSLIIVLVKIRQHSLYKVSLCSWLVPVPVSTVCTGIIVFQLLDEKVVYLLICCIFRWPLIFLGTALYITTLYKVLSDKIRRFASSLTVVTFLMCLFINFYLITKDSIQLFCIYSFETKLISYMSGFVMNFLILAFYIILIILDYRHCIQTPKTLGDTNPNYSLADTCCKISDLNDDYRSD